VSRLVVTPRAAADLEDIGDYIALDNPTAAARVVDRLEELSILLADHPRIGTARDDIATGVRAFPIGSYLILFRSLDDGVEIVRCMERDSCEASSKATFMIPR
jgi:toxin ParE1/3/4